MRDDLFSAKVRARFENERERERETESFFCDEREISLARRRKGTYFFLRFKGGENFFRSHRSLSLSVSLSLTNDKRREHDARDDVDGGGGGGGSTTRDGGGDNNNNNNATTSRTRKERTKKKRGLTDSEESPLESGVVGEDIHADRMRPPPPPPLGTITTKTIPKRKKRRRNNRDEDTRRRAKTKRKNSREATTIRKCPWILIRKVELD